MAEIINSVIPKTGVGRVLAVARAFGSRPKPLTRDAIAAKLNMKAGTGSANNRVIAAKKFGVIETGRSGGYVLTDLGRRLAVPVPERADIVAAIRHVASFAKLIDETDGDPADLAEADVRAGLRAAGVRAAELETAAGVFISSWNYKLPDVDEGSDPVPDAQDADDAAEVAESAPLQPVAPADATPSRQPNTETAFLDHQMVRWVLEQAPAVGDAWPADRYEAWSELLRTTIRFLYPDTARSE